MEPQGFKVLTYLLERRDRVVSKPELFEALWPEWYVTEATLTQRLVAVRRALGDDERTQQYIRTVHGRGYRFVAPVVEQACEASSGEHKHVRTIVKDSFALIRDLDPDMPADVVPHR